MKPRRTPSPTPAASVRTTTRGRSAKGKSPAPKEEAGATHDRPLYARVAGELTDAISSGTYPVGAQLPTELELCEHFNISRHTAREALRVLTSAGLVRRRQRAGTAVIATPADTHFVHDVRSLGDLQQYAKTTHLGIAYIGTVSLNKTQAERFGAQPGDEWIYATGLRMDANGNRPICVTRLFLNPMLTDIEAKLRGSHEAVYTLIEREYGISIATVAQEFRGVVLDVHDAGNLGLPAGTPGLQVLRSYYDASGRLIEHADSVHPSDRFTYRMVLRK
ncbi:MAG: GntR family transcriptional regulator [Acidovorax soli]|uniref:GntR family transcriptional regulator n=1 Tax=Acidovorax soli TaxID=592050 RepID=UPI0026EF5D87|nr:GntR family transcriptional regulator [Acidovorax soli]MCM2346864.1 GntR family transcriptional regulator [Acidovorax soli]